MKNICGQIASLACLVIRENRIMLGGMFSVMCSVPSVQIVDMYNLPQIPNFGNNVIRVYPILDQSVSMGCSRETNLAKWLRR